MVTIIDRSALLQDVQPDIAWPSYGHPLRSLQIEDGDITRLWMDGISYQYVVDRNSNYNIAVAN